jgi:N-dimethylarginine dimethylaminohydrolase
MTKPQRHDRSFYLCPPTYYSIDYAINDWMDPVNAPADRELAQRQWDQLVATYEELGLKLTFLDALPGLPDLVFPGDSVFLCGNLAIGGRFRHAERQPEVEPKLEWFAENGFEVTRVPDEIYFEGNAEAVRWNGLLFGGYGVRSDREAYDFLQTIVTTEIVPLQVKRPFFHLDVALLPLNDQLAAYVPTAFEEESLDVLRSRVPELIAVNPEEAQLLACNAIVVDKDVIIGTRRAPQLCEDLSARGFNPIEMELTEFRKSGGSVKCLTLEQYN